MTELKVHTSEYMIELMVQEEKVRKVFAERLALACDKAGLDRHGRQAELAKALKVTPKAVSKWFNAESVPRRGKMAELSKYIGARSEWLIGDTDVEDFNHDVKSRRSGFVVELLDVSASAGKGVALKDEFIETIKSIEYSSDEARLLFGSRPQENIKLIAVNGDSMSGTFEPRDQIFVDVSINYFDGDGIYIFVLDNDLYVKRLQLQHTRLAVISDNKKYETWYIDQYTEANLNIVSKVLISQSRVYKIHS